MTMFSLLLLLALGISNSFCDEIRRQNQDTVCYGDYGCFHKVTSLPVPQSPSIVNTVFKLHRRGDNHVYSLRSTHMDGITSWLNHFNTTLETKFIIHGFQEFSGRSWIVKLISELFIKGDYNVIVVDWRNGASTGYSQAAGNTYLVGAELAYVLKYIRDQRGYNLTNVHLIGHSLGAQISGHAGRDVPGLGRISALDAAAPSFSGTPLDQHLDASDANFVDVIHTDASNFVLVTGYGVKESIGHIDFYPNGGQHQPGCPENLAGALNGFLGGDIEKFVCSHTRSTWLFIESVNSACKFYGYPCAGADAFEAGNCTSCPSGVCPIMGFESPRSNERGAFFLSTSGVEPFCGNQYFVDIKLADHMPRTYGEFMITLVGSKGQSEVLKFESVMQFYDQGAEETHVIATHNVIGTLTSLKLQFVKANNSYGNQVANNITVHSVNVVPFETNQGTTFCPNGQVMNAGQTYTITSTSGC